MRLLHEFYHREVPKDTGEVVLYYQQSLNLNELLLAVYFSISFLLLSVAAGHILWVPLVLLGALLCKHLRGRFLSVRVNLLLHALITLVWSVWFVVNFGWGIGGQHMLVLLIPLVFFSLYEPPSIKILYFLVILFVRMLLYDYAMGNPPLLPLDEPYTFFAQLFNSLTAFFTLACCCVIYSGNLQESERELLLHNEMLQQQAETDPLTRLINRRALMKEMNQYIAQNPEGMYSVAIADIDFFKAVNDTYGHNCGDYVLKTLAALFTELAGGRYSIGRWGGEEFCFFLPGLNIDDAGAIITEVCNAVRRMKLEYEGSSFSITLTAGVEESDYRSPLVTLIDHADQKLYMGKKNGRDQVVI